MGNLDNMNNVNNVNNVERDNDEADTTVNNQRQNTPASIPQSTQIDLSNGETIEAPPANLAAAKGTIAAQKQAERATDTPGLRTDPNTIAVPEPLVTGDVHDEPLLHGTPVYTTDGARLGIISDRPSLRDHLIVQMGKLLVSDLYIPRSAIARQDADGVHLNISEADVKQQGWDTPPQQQVLRRKHL